MLAESSRTEGSLGWRIDPQRERSRATLRQSGISLRNARMWLIPWLLLGSRAEAQERSLSPAPGVEWTECLFEQHELAFGPAAASGVGGLNPARLQCGHIVVPENRRRSAGPTIRLAFAIVKAEQSRRGASPVVYLEGGPGAPGLTAYSLGFEAPTLAIERDFILFDQRGTGRSGSICPTLAADEREMARQDLTSVDEAALRVRVLRACLDELRRLGIDPGGYDMEATVGDLEDLRRALGYDRWILLARSYGGALAQRMMRYHPETVQGAILISPVPLDWSSFDEAVPNAARSLERIFRECAAQAVCREAFPDPAGELRQVYAELHERPWTVQVDTSLFGSRTFTINARDFMEIVDQLLYADWNIPYLPRILRGFAERDSLLGAAVVERVFGGSTDWLDRPAVRYSVWCRDAVTEDSDERFARAAAPYPAALRVIGSLYLEVCDTWPVTPGPVAERAIPETDIPTLILSGGYDHVTPVAGGAAILRSFRDGRQLVFPSSSHVIPSGRNGQCVVQILRDFLADPTASLDTSCMEELSSVQFTAAFPDWVAERLRR